jgi:biopolymer transport protein ExbB
MLSVSRVAASLTFLAVLCDGASAMAAGRHKIFHEGHLDVRALIQAGGIFSYLTIALSVAMVALIIEHLLSVRREALMPRGLIEQLQRLIHNGQLSQAEELCRKQPTLLSEVMFAGLQKASAGYPAVEKAMEDVLVDQSARLQRKVEYLSTIGAIAPMLGLLGTVWGIIQAFAQFAAEANPSPSDFAPGISEALVTTMLGLCVAIPAMGTYAWFRNRVDDFVSQAARVAEYLAAPLRTSPRDKRKGVGDTGAS